MRILKIILKVVLAVTVFTFALMYLWNWLIPDIFKGPQITYIQSLGLLLLSKLLLSPFGRGCGSRSSWGGRHRHWKKFEEKLNSMSEEEREKFKAKFEYRC